ncbi:Polygalacturonase [Hibiscus syriacus]|uniref:Polygalacturonase n=1 Tax=Hibiscus syriacus TaxID=106335 RepID=A0A6A3AGK9_HIBSY|nr:Polygalacturonase [Hibiscus syriacus]
MTTCPLLFLPLLFLFIIPSFSSVTKLNVLSYGAKPDGSADSTKAFLAAWTQACASTSPASIYVPRGMFLLRNVKFQGQCKNRAISIRLDGTLVAPADYRAIGNADSWVLFQDVDGVSILGGKLDARGTALWACKNSGKSCPSGATSLSFSKSKNIVVAGLSSENSQMFHIVINGCQNVKMQGVTVTASGDSPNTDGIHVQLSSGVILNSKIQTGDDCVSIGPGATNLWMEQITCGPGHGISIGSLGKDQNEAGVQNVTVKRPHSSELRMNVQNPILIDQNYCPGNNNCPDQVSGIKVSDVTYRDIHGTSATQVAVNFDCSSKHPCSGIRLEGVSLTYKNELAAASCKHAGGTSFGVVQPTSCL